MIILSIDPGTEYSGAVIVSTGEYPPTIWDIWPTVCNKEMLYIIKHYKNTGPMIIEMPEGRGQIAGQSTFETCFWAGRFCDAFQANELPVYRVYRRNVKMHLTGMTSTKDANVSAAIRELYEPSGGGARPEVGTKAQPGPLFGMSKDAWAALGAAITWQRIGGELVE